jgi:hypothetical protein
MGRAVNDHTSDVGRRRLLGFPAWLVGTDRVDRDEAAVVVGGLAGRALVGRVDAPTSDRVAGRRCSRQVRISAVTTAQRPRTRHITADRVVALTRSAVSVVP